MSFSIIKTSFWQTINIKEIWLSLYFMKFIKLSIIIRVLTHNTTLSAKFSFIAKRFISKIIVFCFLRYHNTTWKELWFVWQIFFTFQSYWKLFWYWKVKCTDKIVATNKIYSESTIYNSWKLSIDFVLLSLVGPRKFAIFILCPTNFSNEIRQKRWILWI